MLYIPYSALKVTFQGFSTTVPVNLYESGEHRAAQFPAKLSGKRWKSLAAVCDRVCFPCSGSFFENILHRGRTFVQSPGNVPAME